MDIGKKDLAPHFRLLIFLVGLSVVIVQLWHVWGHMNPMEFLFGGLPPLVAGGFLVLLGLGLPRMDLGERAPRVGIWTLFGLTVGAFISILFQLNQAVNGGVVMEPYLVTLDFSAVTGTMGGVIGVFDADRLEKRESLSESKNKFQGIIENIKDGFIIVDPEGRIEFANQGMADLVGFDSPSDIVGRNFVDLIHESERREHKENFERSLKKGEFRDPTEIKTVNREGGAAFVEVKASPVLGEEDEVEEVRAVVRDRTAEKREREAREMLLSLTYAAAQAPSFRSALESLISRVIEINGWAYGEAWLPERGGEELKLEITCDSGKGFEPLEKEGKEVRLEWGEGLPGLVMKKKGYEWVRDISEAGFEVNERCIAAYEECLKSALGVPVMEDDEVVAVLVFYQFDSQEVNDRQVELISIATSQLGGVIQRRRLEEEREVKNWLEILNRIVRHDIRNDLQVISGIAESLKERDLELEEEIDDLLTTAFSAIETTETARDLVEVFVGDGFETEPTDMSKIVEEEVSSAESRYRGAIFEMGEVQEVTVAGNSILGTVVRNLLNNAVQHNDKEEPRVEVSLSRDDGCAVLSVEDNGPGVPDDMKERVFGKGEKGLESEGTGIGLYLVDQVVKEFGGEAWIEDREPEGAVCRVRLDLFGDG